MLKSFSELITAQQKINQIQKIAVAGAADEASLLAVFDPRLGEGMRPILIGPATEIKQLLTRLNLRERTYEIIDQPSDSASAQAGVDLVRLEQADILMKGGIQTQDFLRPVVAKQNDILAEALLSHLTLNQLPNYTKLLLMTDGGMNPEPDLATKIKIAEHGLKLLYQLGYQKPRMAILAAAEVVNPKIRASLEGEALQRHFEKQTEFPCFVDGPLSFDLAVSPEIARKKNYQSSVAGQADLLIGPDMTAMNLLGKSLSVFGQGKVIGLVHGAKVPLVLTSRGVSAEEKYLSLVLASFLAASS